MSNFKSVLAWVHLCLLVFILLNFASQELLGYRVHTGVIFYLKVLLYVSGILLFLKTLRPFKPVAVYFSYYALAPVIFSLFLIFGGISMALISSIAIYPISPKPLAYNDNTLKIYQSFSGFMGGCCQYEVVQPKVFLIEKFLGSIRTENPINADTEFLLDNHRLFYKYLPKGSKEYQSKKHIETEILSFH